MFINFIKISLLQGSSSIYKFDIICLSETLLDNSYRRDNDQLALAGYNYSHKKIVWKRRIFRLCNAPALTSSQSFRKGTKSSGKF